jgi:hypothetical protein
MKMLQRPVLILATGSTLIFLASIILFNISRQPNDRPNGFSRDFKFTASLIKEVSLPTINLKEVTGLLDDDIYFSALDVRGIFRMPIGGGRIQFITIPSLPTSRICFTNMDSNTINLFTGGSHSIYRYDLKRNQVKQIKVPGQIFSRGMCISGEKYFLRQCIPGTRDQGIYLYDAASNKSTTNSSANEYHRDGGIFTDGKMAIDNENGLCAYIYGKTNKILLYDTSMNVQVFHTIDTITTPVLKVVSLNGPNNTVTNTSPMFIYNKAVAAHAGKLLVYSRIKADNETSSTFNDSCSIDIYSIPLKKYLGSLKLPKYNNQELNSICYNKDLLIAGYEKCIGVYKIN